jgi:hypothetical protein
MLEVLQGQDVPPGEAAHLGALPLVSGGENRPSCCIVTSR